MPDKGRIKQRQCLIVNEALAKMTSAWREKKNGEGLARTVQYKISLPRYMARIR